MSVTQKRMASGQERHFVDGAFRRFFFPSLLSNLGLALGGMADCLVVGSALGADGLSAISLGIPVYMFYNLLSYGFSIGGAIHYTILMGNGKPEEANRVFGNVLRFLLFTYLVTAALGIAFLPQLLGLLGADPAYTEVYTIATGYIRAQLICVPIMFCQGPFYYFVHADGAPKRAAAALTVSNAVDIGLNYLLVLRLGMGAEGSVWSTVIGAMFCLAICGWHITRKRGLLRFCWPPFDLQGLWRCIRTGFSSAVQYVYQFITVLSANTILFALGGPIGVAVFDVVYNLSALSTAVADGLGMTLQPMVSTYRAELDAPAIKRTIQLALRWGTILTLVVILVLGVWATPLCEVFGLSGEAGKLGVLALRIYCISVLPSIWNQIAVYYRQTMEEDRPALIIQTLRLFVLFLLFLFPLSHFGLEAFWWVFPLAELGTLVYVVIAQKVKKAEEIQTRHIFSTYIQSTALLGGIVEELQTTCEEWNCTTQQGYYATLVVEEICAAILEDADCNQRTDVLIKLTVVEDEDGFTLHLRDNSYEFNPFAGGDGGPNALGMSIVRKKAKEFFYRRYQGFNTLVVIL